jgi:hypothetical protein
MSVLDSIIKWAEQDLPNWQSDAVRRLLTQTSLTDNDKDDILAMLKSKNGLVDSNKPAPSPQPVKKGDVSGAPQIASKITLKAIEDLSNVNAIPDGSRLLFGHEGLTVIYGENATGKSGYARVLKKACRARDTKEQIHPNIYSKDPHGPAKATFKISVSNGPDQKLQWEDGKDAPEELANIAVFDSKCARIIIDEKNEPTYLPYGSHIFGELVGLLQEFRSTLGKEKPQPEILQDDDILPATEAGQLLSKLSFETPDSSIERLAKWSSEDEENLIQLKTRITKAQAEDPLKQTQAIRNKKGRFDKLGREISRIDSILSESPAEALKQQIDELNTAEQVLAIASQQSLAGEPLPGAGGKVWQKLYEAARQYSVEEAYPGKDFPQTGEGSRCVLCMQILSDDAKARMQRFKTFMEKTVKRQVDIASQTLENTLISIRSLDFTIRETYNDVLDEIRGRNPALATKLEEYIPSMKTRAEDMLTAGTNKKVSEFSARQPNPSPDIEQISKNLEMEAVQLENAAEPEVLNRLISQKDELEARKYFTERKGKILTYVEKLRIAQKYDACISETKHKAITDKGKDLICEALTPQLLGALKNELSALGSTHLNLGLKASGGYGETSHKMELPNILYSTGIKLSEVLSEGEQHVVGIAGFLAELSVAGHSCPIVFDDPVCSLDHRYREKVAERLVKEAKVRQVIIFTHDIVFLFELETKAAADGNVKFLTQTVRYDDAPGSCCEGLPWHSMHVKERLTFLNNMLHDIWGLHTANRREYNRGAGEIYALLRATWEAAVEEVLFHGVIRRYCGEVHTRELRYVTVTDDHYKKIHWAMSKCSKWLVAHDKAKPLDENRPLPGEIQEDINTLSNFVKDVKVRSSILENQREKLLEPGTAEMG